MRVHQYTKIRQGIYRIETAGGKRYSLKQMPMNMARLRWVDRMLQRVRAQGCRRIVWRVDNVAQGRARFVISQGATYVLMHWLSGRQPSPRSQSDMRACGALMARFHTAGRSAVKQKKSYNESASWLSLIYQQRRKLLRFIALARRNYYPTEINQLLRAHARQLIQYADEAVSLLRKGPYQAYRRASEAHAVLCHGDGGPSNFIRNRQGTYLLDFETLQLNLRAYDLYRLVYNSCKDHQWDFSIVKAIIEGYNQVSRLHKNDILLILPWLRFPRTTCLVLGPSDRFPLTRSRLLWAFASERRVTRLLNQLKQYAATFSS